METERALPGVAVGRRRLRRPSGTAPPLPRRADWHRLVWVGAGVVILGFVLGAVMSGEPLGQPLGVDVSILRWAEGIRTTALVDVSKVIDALATTAAVLAMRWAILVVLVIFRRFRHVAVALVTWAAIDLITLTIHVQLVPPNQLIPPIKVIQGPTVNGQLTYYFPGAAIVALSVTVFTALYVLVPTALRARISILAAVFVALVCAARVVLASSYPSALVYGAYLGALVVQVVFAWLAPHEAFPVSYRRGGNAAHLDLGGARGEAVKQAMRDQLAIEVVEVKAFGDEGSGGSTPLLMTTADGTRIFGKILATSHVRADRWYRIMRTILYGQLEDEAPFGSVRRLIGYEDYALRLLDDDRIRVARSYGIVELTPNAEYLLPTEFFEQSQTLGHAEVNDQIVDEGMALIRTLWDAGLAHRDIKPANLLVVDGRLQLIDVSGLEVRPSPWRQAVDFANMMLVMALRTDTQRVYDAALRYFTPEEVGEAFACAQGLAIPTELQRYLKQDPRDLIGEFKRLAPPYPKVSIQQWSAQRIVLTVGAALAVLLVIDGAVQVIRSGLG
jgi:membrane-associated phospholipid phosphatase